MTRKNNLSPLPFYTNILNQNQNDWYAYGHLFSYRYEIAFVPPFQIIIPDNVEPIGILPESYFESIAINNPKHQFAIDVKTSMINDQGLTAEKFVGGYVVVKNKSTNNLTVLDWNPLSIPGLSSAKPSEGNHFLSMSINGTTHSSEIFTWKEFVNLGKESIFNIQLRYRHNESFLHSFGHIDYDDFNHIVNIKSTIGKPSYEFEEDIVSREGYKFPVHQISYKKYQFEFFASEYFVDALRIVRMHDFVEIEHDGELYQVDEILFTINWQEQGNLAQVVCEFTTDTVVAITGRSMGPSDVFNPPAPPPPPPVVNGDYNNDYNNDYANL